MNKKGLISGKTAAGIVIIGAGIYSIATPSLPYYSLFGTVLLVVGFFLIASD